MTSIHMISPMNTTIAFVMPGGAEWMIIFLVMLLLFGAKKLPELARGIGRSLGEFRKAKDEFESEIKQSERELDREENRRLDAERRRKYEESKRARTAGETAAIGDTKAAAGDALSAPKSGAGDLETSDD